MDDRTDRMARAICREKCAYMGEPPCYDSAFAGNVLWPNPDCDEPGCQALAQAAAAAIAEPPMSERRCETCRWWDREHHQGGTDGLCRKYAPRATVMETEEVEEYPVWPKTDIRDWCGEHQPREVPDA